MARIQLKIWRAPFAVLSSAPPVGLAEGEVAIAIETNSLVKRPDGDNSAPLISIGNAANSVKVRAASTAPITLAGLQSIDGVFLQDKDLVMVKDQSDITKNGLYYAAVSAWVRYVGIGDMDSLAGTLVVVEQGAIGGDTLWMCTSDRGGTLGSSAVAFKKIGSEGGSGGGGVAGDASVTSLSVGTAGSLSEVSGSLRIAAVSSYFDLGTGGSLSVSVAGASVFTVESNGRMKSALYGYLDTKFIASVNGKTGGSVTLSATDVGALATTTRGAANGVASLDSTGKVPTSQLPAAADAILSASIGVANGVAGLDANARISEANLPSSGTRSFTFQVNFTGSDPGSVTGLPAGWSASISGTTLQITHSVAKMPTSISYFGYNTGSGTPTWRYRLPTAANEMLVVDASKTSVFSFVLNTSISAADLGGKALVTVQF
jgi:hypothetical protein